MVAVPDKVDTVTELFYGGKWNDITATNDVYTRDPITITRGRPDQSQRTVPSQMSLSIENQDGKYSNSNVASALFGLLGRNTPIRESVRTVVDSFSTAAVDSWSAADTGETWALAWVGGAAADFDVAAGVGTMVVDGVSEYRIASFTDIPRNRYGLVEAAVTCTLSVSNITGGPVEPANLLLRMLDVNNYYMARVSIDAAEVVTVKFMKRVAGVESDVSSPVTISGLTHSGQAIRVRFQAEGNALRAKVWAVSTGEPFAWHATAVDTTFTSGLVGIRSGVAAGNTNVPLTFSYDDFEVRLPRFNGEIESWPKRWNVKGNDIWAPVNAYGILRRLNAPGVSAPVQSALRRAMLVGAMSTGLIAYWPFEEGTDADTSTSLVTGVRDVSLSVAVTPAAVSEPQAGSAPYAAVNNNAPAFAPVTLPATAAGFFSFTATVKGTMPRPSAARAVIYNPILVNFASGNISSIQVSAYARWTGTAFDTGNTGLDVLVFGGTSFGSVAAGLVNVNLFDGNPHDIQVRLAQSGADVAGQLWVDGVQVASATSVTKTLGPPSKIQGPVAASGSLGGTAADNTDTSFGFGHYAIHNNASVPTPHTIATGQPGERAADRISRLCAENGIAFTLRGTASRSELVGVQRVASFVDLLNDCVDADGGILYEPRGLFGLAYCTQESFYNQASSLDLNYSAGGEVAPPLEPLEDTDATVNDVTVTRYQGISARAQKLTGTLNVQEPSADPDGVGRIPKQFTLVLATDDQAYPQATWRRHVGTWDEERYPVVPLDFTAMKAQSKPELATKAAGLDVGNRFTVTAPPPAFTTASIDQLAQSFIEVIESHHWTIDVNAIPARPYAVGVLDTARLDCGASTLQSGISAGDTALTIVVADNCLWSTVNEPYDIDIEGDVMTCTVCTGASSPQSMTVTRSATARSHSAGAPVHIANPIRLAR